MDVGLAYLGGVSVYLLYMQGGVVGFEQKGGGR